MEKFENTFPGVFTNPAVPETNLLAAMIMEQRPNLSQEEAAKKTESEINAKALGENKSYKVAADELLEEYRKAKNER